MKKLLNNIREWVSTVIGVLIIITAITSIFTLGMTWEVVLPAITAGSALILGVGKTKKPLDEI